MTPVTTPTDAPTPVKTPAAPPPAGDRVACRRHAVELRSVTKSFGSTVAVDDLSLRVPERTICGFIGPNGSGKTTTLRMIMRIYRPDEGAGLLRVLGHDDLRGPPDNVGYLPEERGLYKRMKVLDILRFYAELKGGSRAPMAARAWLERLGLGDAADKRVETLSKGNAQKVQFIAAVINQPRLLILDEPFSGLDPVNADVVRSVMLNLKRSGTTMIYSTHDMHMAEQLCDEIVMMHRGRKVLDGTLAAIQQEHGADTIRVELQDGETALNDIPGVVRVRAYGRLQELQMTRGYDAQRILKAIIERGAVRHFEVCSPSLHDVFVRIAGPPHGEHGNA